jgi:urea transporter
MQRAMKLYLLHGQPLGPDCMVHGMRIISRARGLFANAGSACMLRVVWASSGIAINDRTTSRR